MQFCRLAQQQKMHGEICYDKARGLQYHSVLQQLRQVACASTVSISAGSVPRKPKIACLKSPTQTLFYACAP